MIKNFGSVMKGHLKRRLEFFVLLGFIFAFASHSAAGIRPQKAQDISGHVAVRAIDFESSLFSLSLESFPDIHKYLEHIIDLEESIDPPLKRRSVSVVKKEKVSNGPKVKRFCKKVLYQIHLLRPYNHRPIVLLLKYQFDLFLLNHKFYYILLLFFVH